MDIITALMTGIIDKSLVGIIAANPVTALLVFAALRGVVRLTKTKVDDRLLADLEKIFPFLKRT